MENTPRAPSCMARSAQLLAVVLVVVACAGMPWYYFINDYAYVEGTARKVQDAGVLVAQGLAWGLVGFLVIAAGYGLVGLFLTSAGGWTRWASPAARDAHLQIELARAQHQVLPGELSSISNTVTNNYYQRGEREKALAELPGASLADTNAPAALPGPLPHEDFQAGVSRIAQLVDRRHIAPASDQILVGYAGATPLYMRAQEWGLAIIAGQSGKGKSALAKLIIAQAALAGWTILVCDPVYHREERSLLRHYLAGLSGAIWKQAVAPEEIAHTVGLAMKIAHRRLDHGEKGSRVLLVVDEFASVAGRRPPVLDADAMEDLFLTATKAAAVGVHTLLIAHDLSGSWFGGQAARRGRDQATHRLICNMSSKAAEPILPGSEYAQQVAMLPVGQALYFDGFTPPTVVSFPRLTPEDVAWAAGTQAPRPYAPWQPRQVAPVADAEVIPAAAAPPARPVPPTVQLDLQAAELVLDCLRAARVEIDAEEIARRTGLPVGTTKNTLGRLRADRTITHRQQGRRYLYSVSAPVADS